jgi:DNA-binding NarL/FixJ family response regulator
MRSSTQQALHRLTVCPAVTPSVVISDLYLTDQVQRCILQFLVAWHSEATVCIYAVHSKPQ